MLLKMTTEWQPQTPQALPVSIIEKRSDHVDCVGENLQSKNEMLISDPSFLWISKGIKPSTLINRRHIWWNSQAWKPFYYQDIWIYSDCTKTHLDIHGSQLEERINTQASFDESHMLC